MTGHEPIIAMRRAGVRPGIVFLNDYQCSTDWVEYDDHATVQILPSEAIETLDLRFLVGLMVSVSGSTIDRATSLQRACLDAGAKTVAAGVVPMTNNGFEVGDWAEVIIQDEVLIG